jgi:hypothetical protein
MEKVLPLFKPFKTTFYFKNFKQRKVLFELDEVWKELKCLSSFKFQSSLNTGVDPAASHCSGPTGQRPHLPCLTPARGIGLLPPPLSLEPDPLLLPPCGAPIPNRDAPHFPSTSFKREPTSPRRELLSTPSPLRIDRA